ncbi:protein phosphatase 1B-like isoform X1 [Ruditapes philippinarum]|uniref:protein phosphatase 1B-like isoform X1 n=1 Tax=Ruditapes philippinarum TaxID=129788 RepID=UPI00295B8670|nr:protein phosphatase 1B-like isoform X1 [Ruditapes philippinarum]XP_060562900.1 protein phosphatase 1B-like isoform X1 [Ruditapes philippinarum]XP_060562901.1 protein phosphatase 1B-like isoform X1 [Ruditapes philippinarum]
MGAFLDKPKTDKHNEGGVGNGLKYGLASMQGWRVEMEDAHTAVIGLPSLKDWSFFAVFDGHAGAKASAMCSDHLMDHIISNGDFQKMDLKSGTETQPSLEAIKSGIKTGFLSMDEKLRNTPEVLSGQDKSGSTAVGVIISPTHIFFANCGDSRAVLSTSGKCAFSTTDHKPINPIEKERIQKAGGSVMIQRVNGSLAVSRALGDFEYKNVEGMGPCEQLVSPEPEIFVQERNPGDEFLVLACDGIWDVMTNEELCDFVRNRLQISNSMENICNQVIDTCLYKGSRDNMSIVVVTFQGAPKVSEEAIKKEEELDAKIEAKIKESLSAEGNDESGEADLPYIMHVLGDIEGLPPGGGLSSKRATVEAILNKLRPPKSDAAEKLPYNRSKSSK